MTTIEEAVRLAGLARTPVEVEMAEALLGAATAGIPPETWPERCPEVLGAYEQLETLKAEDAVLEPEPVG
jgi:hypothetical protein